LCTRQRRDSQVKIAQDSTPPPLVGEGRGEGAAELRKFAKELRTNQTDCEKKIWTVLRDRRFEGIKFRRQQPIGPYIVDFVSFEQKLIIELDGGQHAEQIHTDAQRTTYLISQGFQVLRFWNSEVIRNFEAVMQVIFGAVQPARNTPHPNPLPQGERG
jgi:very-short-patch-repair endonuclease